MRKILGALALGLMVLAGGPARAATSPGIADGAWHLLASSGSSVDVQNTASAPLYLTTGGATPSGPASGFVLQSGERFCRQLSANLYGLAAAPASFVVSTDTACQGGGSGGASGNAATTSNGSDAQATSATNQQNVVYNYLFNGATWDRVRGTGGAMNMVLTGAIPGGTNTIGTVNLGTLGGAATAAKQPALGVAGTPATDVLTVQGASGGTPLPVIDQQLYNAISAASTPTSTKGTPTTQMLTTQDGNAVLPFAQASATATGVVGAPVSLASDGAPYTTWAVQFSSMATGGQDNLQCTIDGTNWVNLRVNQAVSEIVSSSIGAAGIYEADVSMCGSVRINQTAYTSGTTTVQGLFKKAGFAPRTINTGAGALSAGVVLTGNMNRNAVKGANAAPTPVANGTAVDPLATLLGAAVNKPYSLPELDWNYAGPITGTSSTSTINLIVGSAGNRQYITELDLKNTGGTASEVVLYDGSTSGAVLWRGHLSASMTMAEKFRFDNPLHTTAGNTLALVFVTSGHNTYVNASGYTAP